MSSNCILIKQNNYFCNSSKNFYRLSMLQQWPGSGKSRLQCSFSFWKIIWFNQLVFLSQTCSGQMLCIHLWPQVWCPRLEKSPLCHFPCFFHPLSIQSAKADWQLLICLIDTTNYDLDISIQDASKIQTLCASVFFFRRQIDPKTVLTQLEEWKSKLMQRL